jgi:RNA polymerase sigma-70 factor (ECF subfamily)
VRILLGLVEKSRRQGLTYRPARVNGQPGALWLDPAGAPVSAVALDLADGRVRAIHAVGNPDKLRHLAG